MEEIWSTCKQAILTGKELDNDTISATTEVLAMGKKVHMRCRQAFEDAESIKDPVDLSDERMSKLARYTDPFPLKDYEKCFHLVPELVNVVTVHHSLLKPNHSDSVVTLTRNTCHAVGGSHPRSGQRRHASARLALHCVAHGEFLFRATEVKPPCHPFTPN